MRYKLLLGAFVLLIATPVLAQKFSPIVVETGKPTPSIVRSGEPFVITYRAKFFDTVLILEEQMNLNSLTLVEEKRESKQENPETVSVEVVNFKIGPKTREYDDSLGFVNVWDFTYTFRIIHARKGVYKVPLFNFFWVEKKAGVTIEEAKAKETWREMPTEEVGIGYISSVKPADKAVKPPPLDIRDEINFVSPIADGVVLRRWAYGVIGIAILLTMIIIFRFAKYSKTKQSQEVDQEAINTESEVVVNTEPILSPKQARKRFLQELEKLQVESGLDLTKSLRFLVRSLLLAELHGIIRSSMTEREIYTKLCNLDLGQKKRLPPNYEVFMNLSLRLKIYQEDIDLGECHPNSVEELVELREIVSDLKLHKRVLFFVKRLVNMSRRRLDMLR